MNRQHSLPEIDDPAEVNPLGQRRHIIDDNSPTMPSWSWLSMLLLAFFSVASVYLVYRAVKAVILYAADHVI